MHVWPILTTPSDSVSTAGESSASWCSSSSRMMVSGVWQMPQASSEDRGVPVSCECRELMSPWQENRPGWTSLAERGRREET